MFWQFLCYLQFWIKQSAELNLECVTKCWLDKTNNGNRTVYAFTRKVLSFKFFNMINWWLSVGFSYLMWIASLILGWKVVEAWSKMLKHSSEQKVRHCGELGRCLKMWEVLRWPSAHLRVWINAERFRRHSRHYSPHIKTCKPHTYGAHEG